MSEALYTAKELSEFDRITEGLSSPAQMQRINSRLELKKFLNEHGKEKCDAMFSELKARDAALAES